MPRPTLRASKQLKKSVTAAQPAPGRGLHVDDDARQRQSLRQHSLLNQFRLRRSTSYDDASTRTVKTSPTTVDAHGVVRQSRSSVAASDRNGRKIDSSGDPLPAVLRPASMPVQRVIKATDYFPKRSLPLEPLFRKRRSNSTTATVRSSRETAARDGGP